MKAHTRVRGVQVAMVAILILAGVRGAFAQPAGSCASPVVTLSPSSASVPEGDAGTTAVNFKLNVEVGGDTTCALTYSYQTVDGTATAGEDYVPVSVSRSGVCGGQSENVTLQINGDTKVEPDEMFQLQVEQPTGVCDTSCGCSIILGRPRVAPQGVHQAAVAVSFDATILNDDYPPVTIDDVRIREGDSGTKNAIFTVSATAPVLQAINIPYFTQDGTATAADGDYVPTEGTVRISPVAPYRTTIAVQINGDTRDEPDETFNVVLTDVSYGDVVDGTGVATILNDDGPSTVSLQPVAPVSESIGNATVNVVRTGDLSQSASVQFAATAGTATAGSDFTPVSRTLTWAAGQGGARSVDIPILNDSVEENDETVRLRLSNPSGAVLGTAASTLTIVDDEQSRSIANLGDPQIIDQVEGDVHLSVKVQNSSGAPTVGANVSWKVESTVAGLATLGDGPVTMSDSQGIARQTIKLGKIPGKVVVTASLSAAAAAVAGVRAQATSVQFEIIAKGNLEELFAGTQQQGELSLAGVLDESCVSPQGSFADLCAYVFGLSDSDQSQVVQEMTPREVPAQGRMALETPKDYFREVGRRLAALRGGGSRIAVDQLALVIDGQPVQLGALAEVFKHHARNDENRVGERLRQALIMAQAGEQEGGEGAEGAAEEAPATRQDEPIDVESRWGFFMSGRVATGDRPGTVREEGFNADILGVVAGVDYRLGRHGVLGVGLGYLDTSLDLNSDGGGLNARGFAVTGYGTYYRDVFYVQGVLSIGRTNFDLKRNVDLPVQFQSRSRYTANGDMSSDDAALTGTIGLTKSWGASSLDGFLRGSFVRADLGDYQETGAGPFDLIIRGRRDESLLSEAGFSWSYAVSRSWGVLQPMLRGSYLREFKDASRLVRGSFVGDVQSLEFVVPTDAPDRSYFNVGAGITATTSRGRSFYLLYDRDVSRSDLRVGTFTFGLRLEL